MKVISINRRKFLGDYIDAHNYKQLPDLFLCSGILLILVLLSIFTYVGGVLSLITIVCVLGLGFGLAVVLKRYFPFEITSCGTIMVTPSTRQPIHKAA